MSSSSIFHTVVVANIFGKKEHGSLYSDGNKLYFFPFQLGRSLTSVLVYTGIFSFALFLLYMTHSTPTENGMRFLTETAVGTVTQMVGYPLLFGSLVLGLQATRDHHKHQQAVTSLMEHDLFLGTSLEERAWQDTASFVVPLNELSLLPESPFPQFKTIEGATLSFKPLDKDPQFVQKLFYQPLSTS